MADLRDQYGNPVRQTDEYGNPVGHTQGGTMGSYGTTGNHGATGYGTQGTGTGGGLGSGGYGAGHVGGGGHMQEHRVGHEGGGLTGVHHRSGSSSSSSSEDDGYGGRRKKGMKEKIKEKIPGVGGRGQDQCGGRGQDQRHTPGTVGNPPATMGQHSTYGQQPHEEYYGQDGYEKKGVAEKIKEKIPGVGGKGQDPRHNPTTVGNPPATMGQHSTYGQQPQEGHYGQEGYEKKGMTEKITEKIPGVGGKGQDPRHTQTTAGYPPATMDQHSTYGQQPHEGHYGKEGQEKKGIMEKIKEKLPGGGGGNREV